MELIIFLLIIKKNNNHNYNGKWWRYKIETDEDEDVRIDDKIKSGAKTIGKKWRNLDSD